MNPKLPGREVRGCVPEGKARIFPSGKPAPHAFRADRLGRRRLRPFRRRSAPATARRPRRSRSRISCQRVARIAKLRAATLTDRTVDDAAVVGSLLDQVTAPVSRLTGDGACDRTGVYAAVHARHPEAGMAAPPRADAVLSDTAETSPTPRGRHIQAIAETGRLAWQRTSGYNQRARIEGQIGRWKQVLGDGLRFHTDQAQATEVAIGVLLLNRMLDLGRLIGHRPSGAKTGRERRWDLIRQLHLCELPWFTCAATA